MVARSVSEKKVRNRPSFGRGSARALNESPGKAGVSILAKNGGSLPRITATSRATPMRQTLNNSNANRGWINSTRQVESRNGFMIVGRKA